MANFTVTRSSLEQQCLGAVIKSEQPEVEKKRTDLLKQNGEFRAKIYALENSLLASLSEAEGSLLDDDKVLAKLAVIKKESAEIKELSRRADDDLKEIEKTEMHYRPLAVSCSDIFFCLEQLNNVQFFYRYSLDFFLGIFDKVLHDTDKLKAVDSSDMDARLKIIKHELFEIVFRRVAPGMLEGDRLAFALELARLSLKGTEEASPDNEVERFLTGGAIEPGAQSGPFGKFVPDIFDESTAIRLNALSTQVPVFGELVNRLASDKEKISIWIQSAKPEEEVPDLLQNAGASGAAGVEFRELLLIQAFRPDRVINKATTYVQKVFGKHFMAEDGQELVNAIDNEVAARTPVLLIGTKGYDASTNLQDIANIKGKRSQLKEISIGSATAFAQAQSAIDAASKRGTWVLLKNVHLAPKQLDALYKKLNRLAVHDNFRLFLSTEINPKLPQSLLQNARSFVFEPAAGVKAVLRRTLNAFSVEEMAQEPAERGRMLLLVAWLHAVVQERLRYAPLGWSKKYEFGEPDLRAAIYTVNQWMTDEAKGKSNLPPDKIPFEAIRELLATAIYGGRVDNYIDDRLLKSFVDRIFTPEAYNYGHALVSGSGETDTITVPEGGKRENFLSWVSDLPDKEQPSWIGLPNNAARVLQQNQATELLNKVQASRTSADDADVNLSTEAGAQGTYEGPAWMKKLAEETEVWLGKLPIELGQLEMTAETIKDPLFRFFNREIAVAANLLEQVRADLEGIKGVCTGEVKLTNDLNQLKDNLIKKLIPSSWRKYVVPRTVQTIVWISDFAERVKQYQRIYDHAQAGKSIRSARVWLGGLMEPTAFFTASRQSVAQSEGVSLEELRMELIVSSSPKLSKTEIYCEMLRFEGGEASGNTLATMEAMFKTEECVVLKWATGASPIAASERVNLPIYLNAGRTELLDTVDFKAGPGLTQGEFYGRGAAVICSALGGV